jgi:6 kDa early secretory antigenic target
MTTSMGSMSVDPARVISLSEQIRGGATGIKSKLDELDGEVSKLRGSWSGSAQQAYDEAQRKWNQSIADLTQLLGNIATQTENISHGYTKTDTTAAGYFGGSGSASA